MRTTLVLDALRMALGQRAPGADVALVHHSDRGSQYTSIDYTQELNDHRVLASVGSVGDAYDNALAESFVDSYKTELIADRVWRARAQLELATVEWVGWFNHDRLHESLGDLPPVEFERLHAAGEALVGPIPDDGSVAPSSAERLPAARIAPGELAGGQNGAIRTGRRLRPPTPRAARPPGSLRSPPALTPLRRHEPLRDPQNPVSVKPGPAHPPSQPLWAADPAPGTEAVPTVVREHSRVPDRHRISVKLRSREARVRE
jgi:hypothetical protein